MIFWMYVWFEMMIFEYGIIIMHRQLPYQMTIIIIDSINFDSIINVTIN